MEKSVQGISRSHTASGVTEDSQLSKGQLSTIERANVQRELGSSVAFDSRAAHRAVTQLFDKKFDDLVQNLSTAPQRGRGITTDADIVNALRSLFLDDDSRSLLRTAEEGLLRERKLAEKRSGPSVEDLKLIFQELLTKLKEIGDETGITQTIEGLLGVITGIGKAGAEGFAFLADRLPDLMSGKISMSEFLKEGAERLGPHIMKALEGSLDMLIGGLRVAGELTGISDVVRGIIKIANGEPISGTVLLGFGIAQVAAFVVTLGGSAVVGPVVKQLGKALLRWALGEGVEQVEKQMVKKFARKFLDALLEHAGDDLQGFIATMCGEEAAKEFMELIAKKGLKNVTVEDVEKFILQYCKEKIIAWVKGREEEDWMKPPPRQPTIAEGTPGWPGTRFPRPEIINWDLLRQGLST